MMVTTMMVTTTTTMMMMMVVVVYTPCLYYCSMLGSPALKVLTSPDTSKLGLPLPPSRY